MLCHNICIRLSYHFHHILTFTFSLYRLHIVQELDSTFSYTKQLYVCVVYSLLTNRYLCICLSFSVRTRHWSNEHGFYWLDCISFVVCSSCLGSVGIRWSDWYKVDAFLKRAHKWGFSKDVVTFNELLIKSSSSLFQKMKSPVHCLNSLLPSKKKTDYKLRNRYCSYTLPQCNFNIFKHAFVNLMVSFYVVTFYVSLSLHCIILTVFMLMHVCCVIFNKVSVSVYNVALIPIADSSTRYEPCVSTTHVRLMLHAIAYAVLFCRPTPVWPQWAAAVRRRYFYRRQGARCVFQGL